MIIKMARSKDKAYFQDYCKTSEADAWIVIFAVVLNLVLFIHLTNRIDWRGDFRLGNKLNKIENPKKEIKMIRLNDLEAEVPININKEKKYEGENYSLVSIANEHCLKSKELKKNSELCGEDFKDEELEKELVRLDRLEKEALLRRQSGYIKRSIRAPMPAAFKKVNGRLVCDKGDKDKPGKSKKGKGKHMDMECCLDPDEYPNPNCYYDPGKYGKYLK